MRTKNDQVQNHDQKRSRKLVLHKETIKNLEGNGFSRNIAAEFPTGCGCSNPGDSCEIDPGEA